MHGSKIILIGTDKFEIIPVLLRCSNLRVAVLTEPVYAERYRQCGIVEVYEISDFKAAVAVVTQLMHQEPIDRIVGPSERGVQTAAFLRSYFDLPGMSLDVAVGFTAKHIMKRRLGDANLPTAPYRVVRGAKELPEAVAHIGLPALLKPS